jgi:hypothetical protein
MNLIDSSYFILDWNIPTGTYNALSESITRWERDILLQLLGNDLYKLVAAYTTASPQRIKDIVEGKEYTQGNYTVKWNGLKNAEKVSLIAYYIYIQVLATKSISFQNVGAVVDGGTVSASGLIQDRSLKLHKLTGYFGQDVMEPSLYNFLTANQADYPEWYFNEYKLSNSFGI